MKPPFDLILIAARLDPGGAPPVSAFRFLLQPREMRKGPDRQLPAKSAVLTWRQILPHLVTVLLAGLARVEVLPLTETLTVLWPAVLVRVPSGLREVMVDDGSDIGCGLLKK